MHNHIIGLDHATIAVADLDKAAETFRRLGFVLTPRGHHAEWGTVAHTLMFGQDYILILAAEGPGEQADRVRSFLAQREGVMELTLSTDDGAAAVEALNRQGMAVPLPRSLSRRLEDGQGTTLMFSEVKLPETATPGIPTRLIHHITAERERHPEWLAHANGAIGIASVTAVVEDPGAMAGCWDMLFGPHAATPTDNTVTVHTGRGLIFLSTADDLTQLHPEAELDEDAPPPPALVALALQVADTDRTAEVLKGNGVRFSRDAEGTIRIPPSEACGVFVELIGG